MKKVTVNTGQVMFSGEIYYYWHLNLVEKSLVKHMWNYVGILFLTTIIYIRDILKINVT